MMRHSFNSTLTPFLRCVALMLCTLLPAAAQTPAAPAEVVSFSPQGEVRRIQQVAVRFSADMARLGEGDAAAPVAVTCPQGTAEQPKGRWVDTRRFVFEWARDLPIGTRCVVTLRESVKTLEGRDVARAGPWEFTTGGPKLITTIPYGGNASIREQEIFLLRPDARPDLASVDQHLQCQAEGEAPLRTERLSREDGLRALRLQQPRFDEDTWDTQWWMAYRCARPLANSAKVRLVWGARIAALSGVASRTDQIINYSVRPRFTMNVTCGVLDGNPGCDPRNGLNFSFSAPVAPAELDKIRVAADVAGGSRRVALRPLTQNTPQTHVTSDAFEMFDDGGKVSVSLTGTLLDSDGRTLSNLGDFPKTINIARLPPYAGFVHNHNGVLARTSESGKPAQLVIAARYVERRLTARGVRIGGEQGVAAETTALALLRAAHDWPRQDGGVRYPVLAQHASQLPAPVDLPVATDAGAMAFHGLPLGKPGLWLVEIDSPAFRASRAEAQRPPGLRAAMVQVTNLNITLRAGAHGGSLIWVTGFDDGKPLGNVEVALYDCKDALIWRGKSAPDGTVNVTLGKGCASYSDRHAVVVRNGDDLAVLQFNSANNPRQSSGPVVGHTILDRTLLKAGETLHLENHVREQVASGFTHLPAGKGTLEIRFNFNETVHKSEIQWNAHGAAHSTWRIPANAKLGRYLARIQDSASGATYDAQFQVEEFRAPVFDAQLSGAPLWRTATQQELPVVVSLNYLAGGAAAGERVFVQGRWTMGAPALVAGFEFTNRRLAPFATQAEPALALTLDNKGEARTTIHPPAAQHAITLLAEMQFSDPNGEVQSIAQRLPLWPHPVKVGVRATVQPGAAGNASRAVELAGVALGATHQPLSGRNLRFTVARARSNSAGYFEVTGEENAACQAATNAQGQARCEWLPPAAATAPVTNEVWLVAAHADGEPHVATAILYDWQLRWAPSAAVLEIEGLNAQDANAALAPGDTAQLRVRAPFIPAAMLLTIEREGVLAHSVHTIDVAETRLPLELKGHYAPNVQIAASFVRPLSAAQATSQNPAGRLETSAQHAIMLRVRPTAYALAVTVKPQRDEARPRESVPVTVTVRTPQGAPAAGARVTLIAVDDALLALRPNSTWNLFAAMTRQRAAMFIHHTLATLLAREIATGRQRDFRPQDERLSQWDATQPGVRGFDRPTPALRAAAYPAAAPPPTAAGGATGAAGATVRSDFSSLALWQTEIVTDAQGTATLDVPLNDSLTRWRIVAVATHQADRFGTGDATLRTVQPLQVVSGLPLSVRSGDALVQKVTLRNTTKAPLTLDFSARAQLLSDDGLTVAADAARGLLISRRLTLKAEENQEVTWPVSVPEGVARMQWRIAVQSADLGDAIDIEQMVTPSVPITVRQALLLQVEKSATLPIAQPGGARANAGGVAVDWKASLGDAALIEVRKWMQAYPFICLEQKTSKLAALGDREGWELLMRELPKYLDNSGLARYFPATQLPGSETLTAYVLDTAAALKWSLPAPEKARMLHALREQFSGRAQALDWAPQDVSMARALALQATLIEQEPARALERVVSPLDMAALPTTALVDWVRYLLASPKDATNATNATRGDALKEAANTLRSRYDVQGTRLNWRNEARENWWWFMWNGNLAAARTAWIVNRWSLEDASWKDELPLLVTGLVGRQQQGHWGTTTANVWGAIALAEFARTREAEPVTGASSMRLGGQSATVTWPTVASTALSWPAQGAKDTLTLSHAGTGAPWATVAIRAAVKLDKPVAQGLSLSRAVTPVAQKVTGIWSVGDVARVTLSMSSSASLTWVVVRDPVPSGATILGRGLARESTLAQQGQQRAGAWPVFEERAAESYRGYYRYVPQGQWRVEYTVRLNNAGTFEFPPARVEAMYAPEIFGETPILPLIVQP